MGRRAAVITIWLASMGSLEAAPAPTYEGLWALSRSECADPEGPNFRTLIKGPVFDQYEYHCKIASRAYQAPAWTLRLTCSAEGERVRSTARLSPTPEGKLVIEQTGGGRKASTQVFQRCSG